MKNDERLFLRKCLITALIAILSILALLWVADTMFNGALMDFVGIVGSMFRDSRPSRGILLGIGVIMLLLIAMVGVVTAYRTFVVQHQLYLEAKDQARRAQALMEAEAQRKSDLITYLAHDLKTPLASVIAYLSLMEEAPHIPTEQRAKYVGIALDKAGRLEQLIGELFEVIRFNLQTIALNRETIRLKFMLEQLADEFYPLLLAQDKGVEVVCDEGLALYGDGDKLARVFNNILKNAAAYSRAHTKIVLSARRAQGGVQIGFENQGDPIPPAQQQLIFEKFYRLDASRASQTGGAGLGLAIAKQIVEAHGGRIQVISDEDATVFTVFLPDGKATP